MFMYVYIFLYFIFYIFFYFYFLFCIIFCIFCVRFYISFLEFVLYSVYDFIINKWHWVTLKSGTRGVKIFWRISVIMLVWFDLERPDLVRQHMYGMSVSQPRPVPRDRPYRAPASPFGTSYMRTHSMRNNNHCIVIELDARKIFTGLTTRDLFRERTFLFVIIHFKSSLFSDMHA